MVVLVEVAFSAGAEEEPGEIEFVWREDKIKLGEKSMVTSGI